MGKALSAELFLSAVDDCRRHSSAGYEYNGNPYHHIAAVSGLRAVDVWHIVRISCFADDAFALLESMGGLGNRLACFDNFAAYLANFVTRISFGCAGRFFSVYGFSFHMPGGRDIGDVLCRCITLACNFYRRCVGSYPCLGAGCGFFNF